MQMYEGGKWRYVEGWTKVYKGLYEGVQRYAGVSGGVNWLPLPTIDLVGDNKELRLILRCYNPFGWLIVLELLKLHHYLSLVTIGCPSTHPAVYFCIPICTSVYLHTPVYTPHHNSVHLCMPSHTSTHLSVPVSTLPCTSLYLCTPPHTSMYPAVPFAHFYAPLHTSIHLYTPAHTSMHLYIPLCVPLHTCTYLCTLCISLCISAHLCIPLHTSKYLCITPSMNFIG